MTAGGGPRAEGREQGCGWEPAGRWRELWGVPGWKGLTLGAFQGKGEQQRSLLGQRQRADRNRERSLGDTCFE